MCRGIPIKPLLLRVAAPGAPLFILRLQCSFTSWTFSLAHSCAFKIWGGPSCRKEVSHKRPPRCGPLPRRPGYWRVGECATTPLPCAARNTVPAFRLPTPCLKELLLRHPLPMPEPACATSAVLPIPHFVGSESLSRNFRHSLAGQSKPSVACDPIYGFACGIQYNTILHILVLNNQDDAPVGYTLCHILNNDSDDTFLFFLQKTMPLPVLLNVLYVLFFVHHSC